ncbi:glycerophosphodiester phosphodiesterase [Marinospirillum insulare]|uniref:Glycerophosphoryl diester phosphodiesterase n=1 Tax=Marinospirillum insulare TaxID=217169 RepID=A0ABQ6A0S2_9GAMM|nr:glycerophosphodiester phosphodiesterase family protein [Marinospirillum insulare]GLR64978.1 glycerophosphoryl diester phosphodiesterase [Marinospirillum insulare]
MLMSLVIAHRGAKGTAPENTLRAIQLAAEQGAQWVELDVMLTADQVPIIFHDPVLVLSAEVPLLVKDTPWKRMQNLQVAAPVGSKEASAPIATLEQAAKLIHQLGMGLNLEIKPAAKGLGELTLKRSLEVLEKSPALNLVISSFDFTALQAAKQLAPNIPRALLYETLTKHWRDEVRNYQVRSIHLADVASLNPTIIASIRELGLEVYVYTVNSVERAEELISWGVKGIFTDYPAKFTRLIATTSKRVSAYGDPV